MSQTEDLRCNICGLTVSSAEAKTHASTSSHNSLRLKIEQELDAVRKEDYSNDSSVILRWKSSV